MHAPRYNEAMPERHAGYASALHQVVDRLFVYGTLRAGQTARSLLANHVTRWRPATTTGRMYAFPSGYPGLIDGDTPIVGELVWLRDLPVAFPLLDAYEGDDFTRILKQVRLPADPATGEPACDEWAWCYVLSDPTTIVLGELITDGDWARYWADSS
jgi:gamma-glutamylcyclotransferase (GGCT)/AIG2-like uncharacterized protein YtfP